MSKALDQLAKNLASGMSRRKALWGFISSFGAAAALTGSKASASDYRHCAEFCDAQANLFRDLCMEASQRCGPGCCAEISLIGFNGSRSVAFNGGFNGGPFICVPVRR